LEGEFVVALGASGCGKSTLLNLIAGFLSPTSGEPGAGWRTVMGPGPTGGGVPETRAAALAERDRQRGLRAADPGRREAGRYRTANEFIQLLGLDGFQNSPVYKLSGGMQQRVGIARALTCDPKLLLMDEPLARLTR
jgi:taurine transport system ATP-binding protein